MSPSNYRKSDLEKNGLELQKFCLETLVNLHVLPKALNVTQSSKQYWRMAASLTLKTSFVLFTVIFAHFSKFLFAGNANPYSGTPFFDPMLDGRKEIAKYNNFMDEIFTRMNIAIKAKHLDPMDLKLLPSSDKVPRAEVFDNVQKVRPYLAIYTGSYLEPTMLEFFTYAG